MLDFFLQCLDLSEFISFLFNAILFFSKMRRCEPYNSNNNNYHLLKAFCARHCVKTIMHYFEIFF